MIDIEDDGSVGVGEVAQVLLRLLRLEPHDLAVFEESGLRISECQRNPPSCFGLSCARL